MYVLEYFGPDSVDGYELTDPVVDYSTKDLLFQLDSSGTHGNPPLPTGLHEFRVVFLNAADTAVPSPAQTLQLYIDNALPDLQIYEVRYKGATVAPCSIVEITETPTPV